jgi:uncharacterized membrane protein
MTSATSVAVYGLVHLSLLAVVLLIFPRLWRPEIPFGVSVPSEGSEEVRRRALRFWTFSVALLTATAMVGIVLLARLKPEMWVAKAVIVPYFALGVWFYTRARGMLLPFARPSAKVGVALRRRRYRDYMNPWWEVIPAGLVVLGLGLHAWLFAGSSKSPGVLVAVAFPGAFVYPLLLVMSVLMAHSKQSIGGGDPSVCLAADEAFRGVWIRWMYAFRLYFAVLIAAFPACIALADRSPAGAGRALPLVLVGLVAGGVAVFFAVGWIIGLRYGQGGWRWAVRQGLVDESQAAAVLDGDGMQDERWKLGAFYFNPSDPSILVETRFGVGWTVNLGSVWGAAVALAFLGTFVVPLVLGRLVK